jgi:hypothetical protein
MIEPPAALYTGSQSDFRLGKGPDDRYRRKWKRIKEADNKYLRVVLLEDGVTVHNAFFDRRFME